MARPRRDPNAEPTRDRILRAAEAAFGERGYRATRLSDIAADVGIRRPSLLHYFGTKEALYLEVVRNAMTELHDAVASAIAMGGATYAQKLEGVIGGLMELATARRAILAMMMRDLVDPEGPAHQPISEEIKRLIDGLTAFVSVEGPERTVPGLPVRPAIAQLVAQFLAQISTAEDAAHLWGEPTDLVVMARALFLAGPK